MRSELIGNIAGDSAVRSSSASQLLVAGDIIRTVAIDATFTSVGVLAVIVAVRIFLSWSLEVELQGRWPWQDAEAPVAETLQSRA